MGIWHSGVAEWDSSGVALQEAPPAASGGSAYSGEHGRAVETPLLCSCRVDEIPKGSQTSDQRPTRS
ncbi:hypothetical protein NDU88_010074 [Pleurodeles waltl]|uniref:Uncharacterized protein n=1 Tax=Pleurodeles waltl TaxID=8319 RepID=A0AAV7PWX3_PLEWA|nr:hypothetical protein NDU88_010074 [Pleurodeles waltl]